MKEKPIIFSTEMVQAILEGRKTQTRRIIKPQPSEVVQPDFGPVAIVETHKGLKEGQTCPYGYPGDVLWVRESFSFYLEAIKYKADPETVLKGFKYKPSIHMPKDYARIWLEITEVKVERLQDITEQDAIAEGVQVGWHFDEIEKHLKKCNPKNRKAKLPPMKPRQIGFLATWCNIHSLDNWIDNPWVWVISFKVLSNTGKPTNTKI